MHPHEMIVQEAAAVAEVAEQVDADAEVARQLQQKIDTMQGGHQQRRLAEEQALQPLQQQLKQLQNAQQGHITTEIARLQAEMQQKNAGMTPQQLYLQQVRTPRPASRLRTAIADLSASEPPRGRPLMIPLF